MTKMSVIYSYFCVLVAWHEHLGETSLRVLLWTGTAVTVKVCKFSFNARRNWSMNEFHKKLTQSFSSVSYLSSFHFSVTTWEWGLQRANWNPPVTSHSPHKPLSGCAMIWCCHWEDEFGWYGLHGINAGCSDGCLVLLECPRTGWLLEHVRQESNGKLIAEKFNKVVRKKMPCLWLPEKKDTNENAAY